MERKLTILMRALLAVALVAITLVLTYEFWRAGNGKSSLDVQEIRLQASISRRSVPGGVCGRRKYPSTMPATPSWCCGCLLDTSKEHAGHVFPYQDEVVDIKILFVAQQSQKKEPSQQRSPQKGLIRVERMKEGVGVPKDGGLIGPGNELSLIHI